MDFNAVYHQASDNYCYPLNEDELIINNIIMYLRVKKALISIRTSKP